MLVCQRVHGVQMRPVSSFASELNLHGGLFLEARKRYLGKLAEARHGRHGAWGIIIESTFTMWKWLKIKIWYGLFLYIVLFDFVLSIFQKNGDILKIKQV